MFSLTQARYRAMRAGLATGILLSICSLGSGVAAPEARAAAPPATALQAPAAASQARAGTLVNGSGSSYVALAMEDWTQGSSVRGVRVNYNGILGSPAGVGQYDQMQTDFAGTEAEVKSVLNNGQNSLKRGFQYVPDVAGAIAIMYNVNDRGGNKVKSLHLDQRTISRIFTGNIEFWDDPAIYGTNGGKKFALPHERIRVVYRTGRSGTTALFYDFVREAARDVYLKFQQRLKLPDRRILELPYDDVNGKFAPLAIGVGDSDAIGSLIGKPSGRWSIGYDEFGYARKHHVEAAYVKNGAGNYVQPFAQNIAEALKTALLRPDLSQELSKVYTSKRPLAYPISAYSYMMTQCSRNMGRATCAGPYGDGGKAQTLSQFMRYVACDGQVHMAQIGYSPLPPNLSQEMVNSIARMAGDRTPEKLTRSNCRNPTFFGSLGAGAVAPPDPFAGLAGGVAAATNGGKAQASAGASATPSASTTGANGLGTIGGGSGKSQGIRPVSFNGPSIPGLGVLPTLVLLATLVIPPAVMGVRRWIDAHK
jgi:phosphate transport system substrate-binding protein